MYSWAWRSGLLRLKRHDGGMRHLLPLVLILPLAACDGPAIVATAGVNIAALTLAGRTVPDMAVSAVTGRDCSVVRLDRGMTYCGPEAGAEAPVAFCTRSLGAADCWEQPVRGYRGVADAPVARADAGRRWHNLW